MRLKRIKTIMDQFPKNTKLFRKNDPLTAIIVFVVVLTFICCRKADKTISPDSTLAAISGYVYDHDGPVSGALVRIQTTEIFTYTDNTGRFVLEKLPADTSVVLTAWAAGYFIGGGQPVFPGTDSVFILLEHHPQEDNPDYQWVSAFSSHGDENNCQNCHSNGKNFPFDEWEKDAHALSAKNIRFLTMYSGTDIEGNKSPETQYVYHPDYGTFPLAPLDNESYFGPGYKLDFPATSGNCAACHTPAAAVGLPYGVDPTQVTGVDAEGIGCDFCHKVWDVKLNSSTGLPYDNMPGVLSFEFRRPPEGHQFFAGPLDDVAPGEDTYTPVQRESRFCAPCHYGTFWGTLIYNSFGEWKESPYSDPKTGQTCQDCHMPSGLTDHFVVPEKGGNIRDPGTIASHRMPGAKDEQLLRHAVSLSAESRVENDEIVVTVQIVNDQTGHHVPTDSPLRHLILLITATNETGDTLTQIAGDTLPGWCGVGNFADGYYAGLPGKAFAKILEDLWTKVSPTAAYWNMTRIVSDNRLAAYATDISEYRFQYPANSDIYIDINLYYRRAFRQLADWKKWADPDILMASRSLTLKKN